MPNWCENVVYVCGTKEARDKIRDIFQGDKPFTTIVPEPDYNKVVVPFTYPQIHVGETAVAGRRDAWWDWRVQNWGTKWDLDVDEVQIDENDSLLNHEALSFGFQTAWSCPANILQKMSEIEGVELVHGTFSEPGCDFVGFITFSEGEKELEVIHSHQDYLELLNTIREDVKKGEVDPVILQLHEIVETNFEGCFEMCHDEEEEEEE